MDGKNRQIKIKIRNSRNTVLAYQIKIRYTEVRVKSTDNSRKTNTHRQNEKRCIRIISPGGVSATTWACLPLWLGSFVYLTYPLSSLSAFPLSIPLSMLVLLILHFPAQALFFILNRSSNSNPQNYLLILTTYCCVYSQCHYVWHLIILLQKKHSMNFSQKSTLGQGLFLWYFFLQRHKNKR